MPNAAPCRSDDERLIVFTEYKTTLDYLARRLRKRYPADRVLTLFGTGGPDGMDEAGRENVKAAFNDPASQVRILVAVNEVFDRAVHRRLIQGEETGAVTTDLDRGIDAGRGSAALEIDGAAAAAAEDEAHRVVFLDEMATEIDFDDRTLRDTLEAATAIPAGRPQLQVAEEPGFYRVLRPDLPGWRDVIDESVRRPALAGSEDARGSCSTRPNASRRSSGPSRRRSRSSRAAASTTRRFERSCSASVLVSWTISCPSASSWPVARRHFP